MCLFPYPSMLFDSPKALLMAADYIENDCEATHKNGTILGKARAAIEKATQNRN